jgi:putative NIF3 family GTP cyclohydrolase 1 type 2
MVRDAAAAGADVLVTGDVSHHQMTASVESGAAVVDPGHARTELPGMRALLAAVGEVLPDPIVVVDLVVDSTPWEVAG